MDLCYEFSLCVFEGCSEELKATFEGSQQKCVLSVDGILLILSTHRSVYTSVIKWVHIRA